VSLISEALRKARQQAIDRGDVDPAPAAPPTVIRLRPRSPLGTGLVIGAAIAVAAGLAGAAAVWWVLGGGGKGEPEAAVSSDQVTSPGQRSRPGDEVASVVTADNLGTDDQVETPEAPGNGSRDRPRVSEGGPSAREAEPAAPEAESAVMPRSEPVPMPGEVVPTPTVSADSGSEIDRQGGARVFVLDAELGYATLSLDFIIYRSEDPFAEINGIEVHEGSEIDGFVVERIERDRVLLRDDRGPLELRAR
jgi:hypothetical protein